MRFWQKILCKQGVLFGVDFYLFLYLIVAASKPIGELIRATQRSILIVLGQIEAPRIHKITSSWPDDDASAVSANRRQNICTKHLVTQRCYIRRILRESSLQVSFDVTSCLCNCSSSSAIVHLSPNKRQLTILRSHDKLDLIHAI